MPRVFVSLRFPVLALAACLTLWRPAVAAPADGAAPDRVYPPLPSMSLLPAGTAAAPDDGAEPAPSSAHAQGRKRRVPALLPVALVRKPAAVPAPRLVVSEASHAYLAGIEQQLEQALKR